jgi:hypothetical protein
MANERITEDPGRQMRLITEDLLSLGRSEAGGWTKAQLALLGVPWPPVTGWKKTVLGKQITAAAAAAFVAGKNLPPA